MSNRRLFALSDPHLSFGCEKPMRVFGSKWEDYERRLRENWLAAVRPDDVVLMPGDISWGMRLADALPDLRWLEELPGEKVLVRGNHDYWWQSLGKMRALGLKGIHFLQNDCLALEGGLAVGGSRLWDFPDIFWGYVPNSGMTGIISEKKTAKKADRGEDAEKIRAREIERLKLSLSKIPPAAAVKAAMTHYPPLGEDGEPTPLTDIIESFGVNICVFGHVHALRDRPHPGADIMIGGVRYLLAASDYLDHAPAFICDL